MIIISIFEKELETFLSAEEIHTIINRVYEQLSNTCSFVFQKGKRTGSVCGRRCPAETYCKTHQKQADKRYCTMILRTGKNKGRKCCRVEQSNGYCKIHQFRSNEPVEGTAEETVEEPVEEPSEP